MRAGLALALAMTFAVSGCDAKRDEIVDCAAMPVKGWSSLLARPPFPSLSHRKDRVFEPLSESSQLLLADSNYEYQTLLTFVFAEPGYSKGSGDRETRCVREASLLAQMPLDGRRAEAVGSFVDFLGEHGVASTGALKAAREKPVPFAEIDPKQGISAGVVEHGGRGRFFRVEVRTPEAKK